MGGGGERERERERQRERGRDLDEVLAHDLLARESRDVGRLIVPLIHSPLVVDAEDWRVGRVDERLQLLRHPRLLHLHLLPLRDVLLMAQHSAAGYNPIPPRQIHIKCIQQGLL